ncbi:MAG: S46 family peptidase [Planctomycetota bacterium]|jgi:chromosome segregation ATPase
METINGRAKHGVVLVLLLAIGVVVFTEQSCYGRRVMEKKPTITIKPVQMRTINEMNNTIKKAEALHESLKGKLVFKTTVAKQEYVELLKTIQELNGKAKEIKKEIEELNNKKAELLEDVSELSRKAKELGKSIIVLSKQISDLEKDKENLKKDNDVLKEDVDNLETAKATIKAWFGGGMFTSITGIVLLVLKIMSQKKDIKLKQIQIDKIAKKKD